VGSGGGAGLEPDANPRSRVVSSPPTLTYQLIVADRQRRFAEARVYRGCCARVGGRYWAVDEAAVSLAGSSSGGALSLLWKSAVPSFGVSRDHQFEQAGSPLHIFQAHVGRTGS
jgi:hypothetical protein